MILTKIRCMTYVSQNAVVQYFRPVLISDSYTLISTTFQWRRKYFWKEGADKILYCPLRNFAGGADFRVGLVYWQWHLTK